jgi:hypothetical protein
MVVSFMIAVPFSLGAPLVGGRSPLLRTPPPRSDTAARITFEDFLARRLQATRQRDGPAEALMRSWVQPRGRCQENVDQGVQCLGVAGCF